MDNEFDCKRSWRNDGIAWTTWNDAGYSIRSSKQHIEDDENEGHTLCGMVIPSEGDGIELDPNNHSGCCKRCEKKM